MASIESSIPRSSVATASSKSAGIASSVCNKGGRKSSSLPAETVEYLKAWMMSPEHVAHPYPTEQEKAQIMAETGIELKQLTNWFVNNRKRYWKPRVEAKLQHKFATSTSVPHPTGEMLPSPANHLQGLSVSIDMANPHGAASQPMAQQPEEAYPVLPPAQPHQQAPSSSQEHAQPPVPAAQHAYAEDPHTISEGSGSSACNSDDDSIDTGSFNDRQSFLAYLDVPGKVMNRGATLRREEVDVHVLRPESSTNSSQDDIPTIRDLTIKGNVPRERILATFPKCQISYTVPVEIENDRKKVSCLEC